MRLAALLGTILLAAAASAADRTRIVILPIVVHSAASDSSYVSRGVTDMISSRLEQTGHVQVERVEDPGAATTVLGKALEWGKSRGGDYLIFGAFTQFGDGASLDVHCLPLDVKNEAEAAAARRIFISSGTMGDIIPKLDEIVDRVAVYTKVARSEPTPGSPATASAPPAVSPEALRDLTRRLEALEKAVFKSGPAAAAAPTASAPVAAPAAPAAAPSAQGGADGASTAAKEMAPPPES